MASTVFTNYQPPAIRAEWLNDVNALTYGINQSTGAQLVGTPEGSVQIALNGRVKTLQNYTALLAYNGFLDLQITSLGVAGFFRYNSTLPNTTNGGTQFAHVSGIGAWERAFNGTVNVMWFGAVMNGSTDDSSAIQAALNSGAGVIDFLNRQAKVNTGLNIPTGIMAVNVNLLAGTVGMGGTGVVLVNTRCSVSGTITGTGTGGATLERGVYAATGGVTDVTLDINVSNLTTGVQINNSGTGNPALRWRGSVRATNLVGGGVESNGYGLLISEGFNCDFEVYATNVPRHDVYLSNGSSDNNIVLHSSGSGGAPVQLFSSVGQNWTENNRIVAFVKDMNPTASTDKYAANLIGAVRNNRLELNVESSPLATGAVQFKLADADNTPQYNYVILRHKDGFASVTGLVRSDSAFENSVEVYGYGACTDVATANLIAVAGSTVPTGQYDAALRIRALAWDAQGSALRGVGVYASYAPVDIGQGVVRGFKNSTQNRVAISGGSIVGYTHRYTVTVAPASVAAGAVRVMVFTYPVAFENFSSAQITLDCPTASAANMPSCAKLSSTNSAVTVSAKNGDASNATSIGGTADVFGY